MADIAVLRTPTPGLGEVSPKSLSSPLPMSSSNLTPPPSTQIQKHISAAESQVGHMYHRDRSSSPTTNYEASVKGLCNFSNGQLPTVEEAMRLSESQCRDLISELIPVVGEARMALAHSKLQLNLLSIESAEAAQRAEAEHELTRREVEVLQAGSSVIRNRAAFLPDPRSPLALVQQHLETSINQGREIGVENHQLHRRLKQAKKVIKNLDARASQLADENALLRSRIRQNREHFDEIKASTGYGLADGVGSSIQSPQKPRETPAHSSRTRRQDPLNALLMADQLLSGEPLSVPTSPSPHRARLHATHTRGTHSLSSLPTTPRLSRPSKTDDHLRTPINQVMTTSDAPWTAPSKSHPGHDRDSTISASENEAVTDDDVPQSQASQAASNILSHNGFRPWPQCSSNYDNQGKLVQSKLVGSVTKPYFEVEPPKANLLEDASLDDLRRPQKKARLENYCKEDVGLGIGLWNNPRD
jgi:hypothetical protein